MLFSIMYEQYNPRLLFCQTPRLRVANSDIPSFVRPDNFIKNFLRNCIVCEFYSEKYIGEHNLSRNLLPLDFRVLSSCHGKTLSECWDRPAKRLRSFIGYLMYSECRLRMLEHSSISECVEVKIKIKLINVSAVENWQAFQDRLLYRAHETNGQIVQVLV